MGGRLAISYFPFCATIRSPVNRILLGAIAVAVLILTFCVGWLTNEGITQTNCEQAEERFFDAVGIASMPDERIDYLWENANAECHWKLKLERAQSAPRQQPQINPALPRIKPRPTLEGTIGDTP